MLKKYQTSRMPGVSAITSIGDSEVLVGFDNGPIKRYLYWADTSEAFQCIQEYIGDKKKINFLVYCFGEKFLSINEDSEIRIWGITCGECIKKFHWESLQHIDSVVLLTDNLLAVSSYASPAWQCFSVWALNSGECIHKGEALQHRPHGMSLSTTADGYLTVSGHCSGEISIWYINRTECTLISEGKIDRIYSMAYLPTGEIVTGSHELNFYKILDDKKFHKYKTLENSNVIDQIYPIAGYKLLTFDRSRKYPLKIWNYLTGGYEIFSSVFYKGDSFSAFTGVILEKMNVFIAMFKNNLTVYQFASECFRFPKNLVEIRKNARILSQAYRTKTSSFAYLPEEIFMKIILLTAEDMDEYEEKVIEEIARNYFSKPQG